MFFTAESIIRSTPACFMNYWSEARCEAPRKSEYMILSLARIVSRVRFCSCHKSFFLLVWYPQLPSNKVTTAFPLTSPVGDQGVRTGLLSMTNRAFSCFIHEELMCTSLSVKKMFTIGEVPIDVSSVTSS